MSRSDHNRSRSPRGYIAIKRQRIVGTRRTYNQWVNDQTLEDYALRFTARRARIWSPAWVGNTALGSIPLAVSEETVTDDLRDLLPS